jgi:hypothetical protein
MPFPEKFRALIELRDGEVVVPDYVWLSYAVCAVEEESCGWRGWIIESAWKVVGEDSKEVEVEADSEQCCPVCSKQVYRTGIEKQFRLNPNAGPKIGYAYETVPVTFGKSKPKSKSKRKSKPKPKSESTPRSRQKPKK